ncbi:protein kinase inhibitor [Malassezia pachydermatis]|uniref:DUF1168-domain-containing protein n=1 Tax=Malassezia pachydermatis TaxID=77020 RepID=A0A0M8MWK4_9BASI|nr:hypothetical protein Malapachy_2513 [Malassezia pachydermatis]KOS15754.1 hypothetical protein Malapachy_2513 [Malassezia pachydermatis]
MEDEVQRATHKRRTLTPAEKQAQALEEMFKNPKRAMRLPSPPRSAYKVREPPEMVDHVQGSSAGVGSGEFHVYKMTRRLESDRIQAMQDEADRKAAQADFDAKRNAQAELDEAKTSKNRARRAKKKMAQQRARESKAQDLELTPSVLTGDTISKKRKVSEPNETTRDHPAPRNDGD